MAMLALFVVLLGASGAYGLGAGGSPNVRDLGPAPKNPGVPDAVAAAPKSPATDTTPPDTVPQATATPPLSSTTPKPSKRAAKARPKVTTTPSTPSSGSPTPANRGGGSVPSKPPKPKPPQLGPEPSWFADGDPPFSAFANENANAAALAVDQNRKTAWVTNRSGVGLVVDTQKAQPYSDIAIATITPGFTVSIYSSNHRKGSRSPAASGWKREAAATVVARHYQRIPLKGDQPRYLVIWIKGLPAGASSASIAEVRLIP